MFVELLACSSFSFLRGASHPEELVVRAKELSLEALGICDRDGLYGSVRAYTQALEIGQRVIVGAELSLAPNLHRSEQSGSEDPPTVAFLIRNHKGYENLCRLLTLSHHGRPKGESELNLDWLEEHHEGLVAIVPAPARPGDSTTPQEAVLERVRDVFAAHCAIAVYRHRDSYDASRIDMAVQWSERYGIDIVASARPRFHGIERKPLADVLHCIRVGTTLDRAGMALGANAQAVLRSEREMLGLFADQPKWVHRSGELAQSLRFCMSELNYKFPCSIEPGETADSKLRRLTYEGLSVRYPNGISENIVRQVERELQLIATIEVAPYFLSTWEIVEMARVRRILCQGRGSAANSAVCYALGITAVDPARSNLLFERFLSVERREPPDIDIDFEHERREEVIQDIYARYGRDRAAMVAEVICYRGKSALREVGKVFGLSLEQVDRLSSTITHWDSADTLAEDVDPANDANATSETKNYTEKRPYEQRTKKPTNANRLTESGFDPRDPRLQKVIALARELQGFPRHLSIHVGGFVLSQDPLYQVAPVEPARMDGRTVVPWDKDDLEALKFFKVDVLGLGMLTAIRKCLALIHQNGGLTSELAGMADCGEESGKGAAQCLTECSEESGAENTQCESLRERNSPSVVEETRWRDDRKRELDEQGCPHSSGRRPDGLPQIAGSARSGGDSNEVDGAVNEGGEEEAEREGMRGGVSGTGTGEAKTREGMCGSVSGSTRERQCVAVMAARLNGAEVTAWCGSGTGTGTGEAFDPINVIARIPAEDAAVYGMLGRADTVGVFQIESRAQMSMLPRLRPKCFYDLVIEVAIVRPGPIQGGMVHPYLRRRNNEEAPTFPHPALESILKRTLGVPLFQEQVMQIAIDGAGYTGGEADQLRRDMAAWKKSGKLLRHRQRLLDGFANKGISQEFGAALFEQIKGFGDYGFPESHAASFALLVYSSAWQKAHYPAHFACALINSQPMGFYSTATILHDAERHGVEVRDVDVCKSNWDCVLEEPSPASRIESRAPGANRALRLGLRVIKGFREATALRIEQVRKDVPFNSLQEVVRRARLRADEVEVLAEAGAFESLKPGRRQAMWSARAPRAPGLFEDLAIENAEVLLPALRPAEQLLLDYRRKNLAVSDHPMRHYRERLKARKVVTASEIRCLPKGAQVNVAGVVICRQQPGTASGVVFITLEDETGFVNLVLWQAVFQKFRLAARHSTIMFAQGEVDREVPQRPLEDGEVIHVIVRSVERLDVPGRDIGHVSRDFH